MSTKIYNGFRFRSADLFNIHEVLMSFRERLQPMVATRFTEWLAQESVGYLDDVATGRLRPETTESPAGHAHETYWEKRRSVRQGHREPSVDFDFNVTVLPFPASNEVYGIVFTEHEDWCDLWFSLPQVEEYAYQNQSDWRPDGVSALQFARRGKRWDDVLGHTGVPSHRGMTADLVPEYLPWPETSEIAAVIARDWPLGRRARSQARDLIVEQRAKNERGGAEWKNHEYMRSFMETSDWLKTPEGASEWARVTEETKPRLVQEVTENVLRDKVVCLPQQGTNTPVL